MIEWYDYSVYGYFAGIIGSVFFPSEDNALRSLLLGFAVFGVGFLMRPLGGFLFGHYGDRRGRRNALAVAILGMTASTFAIGLLPSYETAGITAAIALVVLRLAQGLSAGGEIAGAGSFLVEHAPSRRRGLVGSLQQFGSGTGLLLGATVATAVSAAMPQEVLTSVGWRIPFLIAGVVGLTGLYLRLKVDETPEFKRAENTGAVASAPLRRAWQEHRRSLLLVFGMTVSGAVQYYIFLVYLPSYAAKVLGISALNSYLTTTIGLVIFLVALLAVGAASDYIGRKPFLIAHAVGCIVLAYPLFHLLATYRSLALLITVQFSGAILMGLWSGPVIAAYAEIFPASVRYSGTAVSYNLSVAAFGGTASFIATGLIALTGDPRAVAWYVIATAIISLGAYIWMGETYRTRLR